MKKILVFLWNRSVDIFFKVKLILIKLYDRKVGKLIISPPKVHTIDTTIETILKNKSSVCRFGDGEFKLINNKNITFQSSDAFLSEKLKQILLTKEENLLICIPDVFGDLSQYLDETRLYWSEHLAKFRSKWNKILSPEKIYYNAFISRFYYPFKDKSLTKGWLSKLRLIWEDREIVLIEGKKSRLGVGNNLFNNANKVERILVPEENAFTVYNQILDQAKKINKTKLILIAAGPTATVLAYELFKEGYQAIDIGHIDIEYEWYLIGAKNKMQIKNKYVCEAGAGEGVGDLRDEKYQGEVILTIE